MKKNKKILVSGGAGFIGSHICEKLVLKGNKVYCIDNLLTGKKKNIEHKVNVYHFHEWCSYQHKIYNIKNHLIPKRITMIKSSVV